MIKILLQYCPSFKRRIYIYKYICNTLFPYDREIVVTTCSRFQKKTYQKKKKNIVLGAQPPPSPPARVAYPVEARRGASGQWEAKTHQPRRAQPGNTEGTRVVKLTAGVSICLKPQTLVYTKWYVLLVIWLYIYISYSCNRLFKCFFFFKVIVSY